MTCCSTPQARGGRYSLAQRVSSFRKDLPAYRSDPVVGARRTEEWRPRRVADERLSGRYLSGFERQRIAALRERTGRSRDCQADRPGPVDRLAAVAPEPFWDTTTAALTETSPMPGPENGPSVPNSPASPSTRSSARSLTNSISSEDRNRFWCFWGKYSQGAPPGIRALRRSTGLALYLPNRGGLSRELNRNCEPGVPSENADGPPMHAEFASPGPR
jgi:hypothetical protein